MIRITSLLTNSKNPFSDGALTILANLAEGVPYSMVYFSEKLLHYALDKNKKIITEKITLEFIETLKLNKINFAKIMIWNYLSNILFPPI